MDNGAGGKVGVEEATRAPRATFDFECRGADGQIRWKESIGNVVTTAGKIAALERMFRTNVSPAWYLLLAGAGTKAAADTLASHAGWTEATPYAGNRPTITWNAAAANGAAGRIVSQQISIAITGTATIGGVGTAAAATGTAGVLYNVADFAGGARGVQSDDTLNVTITLDLT